MVVILILIIFILLINKKEYVQNNTNINNNVVIYNNDFESNNYENNTSNETVDYNFVEYNQIIEKQKYNIIEQVTDKKEYFTINNILNKYVELIGNNQKEDLLKILAPNYLQEFSVTFESIENNIPRKSNDAELYHIEIDDMLKAKVSDRTNLYFISSNVSIKYTKDKYPLNIMIETDGVNLLYNIYPDEYLNKYKLNNLIVGTTIKFSRSEITNRDNLNKYSYVKSISDVDIANKLFDNFVYKLKTDTINAYEKLNKNYVKTNFNTYELFNKYIEESKNIFSLAKMTEYRVFNTENYTDYICTDQYSNYYIFRQQNGVMNYSVFLDSYSVELESIKGMYNEANDNTKVSIQINKVKEMLNLKDYTSIYNKLNKTFRNNNFNNVSELEAYLKTRMYNINYIEINNITINDDYFVCECTLKNQENNSENKSMTIIIKLIDANNFEMSFSF